jgi:hypothetical protein
MAKPRVWRFSWFGLIVTWGFFIAFATLGILWLVVLPSALPLVALLAAGLAYITWRIARSTLALYEDRVVVRNPAGSPASRSSTWCG